VMARKAIALVVACICAVAVVSTGAASTTRPSSSSPAFEIPIDGANHPVFIPTTWGGKAGYFILDTGCTESIFDETSFPDLRDLRRSVPTHSYAGHSNRELYEPPDLTLGPIHLNKSGMAFKADLSSCIEQYGRKVFGIIGLSDLTEYVVQIDFDRRTLRFYSPDFETHPDWGRARGMQMLGGNPAIRISGPDGHIMVDIDMGWAGSISVPSETFDSLWKRYLYPITSHEMWSVDGPYVVRSMRSSDFEIYGWRYRDVILTESKDEFGAIGRSFLSRHMVTFDFPNLIFYLKPGNCFNRRDEDDMAGMEIRQKLSLAIAFVRPLGPAYNAGMRDGDIVLNVNGKAIEAWDLLDLKATLKSEEGETIAVTFQRDGVKKRIVFKLRRQI
jgi:hypothetical protein